MNFVLIHHYSMDKFARRGHFQLSVMPNMHVKYFLCWSLGVELHHNSHMKTTRL